MMNSNFYTGTGDSQGLYGNSVTFGGTYFQWFIYYVSATAPATPTGGSWDFTTNTGTPPTNWLSSPPSAPLNQVWVSIAIVSSLVNAPTITWSTPGLFTIQNSTSLGTMAIQNANSVSITGGSLTGASIGGGNF
jgi:hypothetical protein